MTANHCSLGVADATLSDWRADLLPTDEAQQLNSHVPTCQACQSRVKAMTRIGELLRAQRVPVAGDSVWRGIQQSLQAKERIRMTNTQRTLALSGLGIAALVVTLFAIIVVSFNGHSPASSITPLPSISSSQTLTPAATTVPTPWQTKATLTYGKGIAFGHSNPLIGYVCGTEGVGATNLRFGITHDGGQTWQAPYITTIQGSDCRVYINPYSSEDVVIGTRPCWIGCDSSESFYRSRDAGRTWTRLITPVGNEASEYTALNFPRWTPTGLFFLAEVAGSVAGPLPDPKHLVAVSINGGPLAWTTTNPTEGGSNAQLPNYVYAFGSQLVVTFSDNVALGTTDQGQSWHKLEMGDNLQTGVITTYTGQTLLSENSASNYTISRDGGQTWQSLPAFPDGGKPTYDGQPFMAPDTTLFLEYANNASSITQGVYRLTPGSSAWVLIAPLETKGILTAISWDATGHPLLMWSVGSGTNTTLPIIAYHPA